MTKEQYLLVKLAEEASEIAQIALKCTHFGINDKRYENGKSNIELVEDEFNDLLGVIQMLETEGVKIKEDKDKIFNKMVKVGKYMKYSQKLGLVEYD